MFLLAGCSSLKSPGQPVIDQNEAIIKNNQSVGQSFVPRYAGLNGISFYIKSIEPENGYLQITVIEKDSDQTIFSDIFSLENISSQRYYNIVLPVQKDSFNRSYYIKLAIEGNGKLTIGTGPSNAYYYGSLFLNDNPVNGHMAFNLDYSKKFALIGILIQAVEWVKWLFLAFLVFIVPGLAILNLLLPKFSFYTWIEKVGLAAGTSLAVYPLLILWSSTLHLFIGNFIVWFIIGVSFIYLLYKVFIKIRKNGFIVDLRNLKHIWIPNGFILFVLIIIFFVRFWAIRTQDIPLWGDSYQHATIAQLIVDHNGLFESWTPYTPYDTFTVHFGFPTATAAYSWINNLSIPKNTLIVGQLINGLSILTIVPLALKFAPKSSWTGIGVLIVGGLLSPLPGQYANWGRFAQLFGHTVFPVSLWMIWTAIDEDFSLNRALLSAITLSGMCLGYYRMPFFYVTFIIALILTIFLPRWLKDFKEFKKNVLIFGIVIVVSFIFILPWLSNVTESNLSSAIEAGTTQSVSYSTVVNDFQVWKSLTSFLPQTLIAITCMSLLLVIVSRDWKVISIPIWFAFLAVTPAGMLINLPGANMMQSFAVIIAIYIPVSILIGWLLFKLSIFLKIDKYYWRSTLSILFLVVLVLIGANDQRKILDENQFALVKYPDLQAMNWINENTSQDSLFLVEGFRIYDGKSAVGSDAGWWIPLLTKRSNTMPPQYALLNEQPTIPSHSQKVVDLVTLLEQFSVDSPESLQSLCEWGITHLYIGQGNGEIGAGATQLFSSIELQNRDLFTRVYNQDKVEIYKVNQNVCR
jgi:hypothetical protein